MSLRSVLVLCVALAAGCAEAPAELGDCPDGSAVDWATVAPIFEANCTRCHASTLVGSARRAAPEAWNYDTAAAAIRDPNETWERIYTDNMPNDADFTPTADRAVLWEWYSCGGPE